MLHVQKDKIKEVRNYIRGKEKTNKQT